MPSFRTGRVTALISHRTGLQRVEVDGSPAYVLTALTGPVALGDRVVLNTTAVDLGLGTGGWNVVHWDLENTSLSLPGGGHVMKLRYTSLQSDTGAAEEALADRETPSIRGMPVVICFLHSQLAPVAAAFAAGGGADLAYVMTDTAALPLALSDLVVLLVERKLIESTITAGNAFGGDLEAVNVLSALQVAAAREARAAVVAPGPGLVGTGTEHGHGAVEVATAIDLAGRRGAVPIVALRWSGTDPRERHRGLSHHSRTALELAHETAVIPVPEGLATSPDLGHAVEGHAVEKVPTGDVIELLHGLDITTMGRSPAEDPEFFAFAAAAGVAAANRTRDRHP